VTRLEQLQAMVLARRVLHLEVDRLVERALEEGEDRTAVARVLGISRASVYRRYGSVLAREEEVAGEELSQLR
jgi:DNA invertase Pin-like site-specific DNA recombinase